VQIVAALNMSPETAFRYRMAKESSGVLRVVLNRSTRIPLAV
jgi:hypothetical protein